MVVPSGMVTSETYTALSQPPPPLIPSVGVEKENVAKGEGGGNVGNEVGGAGVSVGGVSANCVAC